MGPLQIRLVGAVRSTQDELWSKRTWLQPGVGVAASAQSAGHGRGGRAWVSPEGGVYVSLLVGHGLPAADADLLGEAAALSVLRTSRELLKGEKLFAKWPNDVVTWGRGRSMGKLAGVVVRTELSGEVVQRAAVGIGINVREPIEGMALPGDGASAVSLEGLARRAGKEWSAPRTKVLEWIAGWLGATLTKAREAPDEVRREFSREVARAPLTARVPGVREQFRPLGVERGGALAVRRQSGKRATVSYEDAERLAWAIAPRPAPAKRKKAEATARAGAGRSALPRSSRGRSARPSTRGPRTRR